MADPYRRRDLGWRVRLRLYRVRWSMRFQHRQWNPWKDENA